LERWIEFTIFFFFFFVSTEISPAIILQQIVFKSNLPSSVRNFLELVKFVTGVFSESNDGKVLRIITYNCVR